MGIFWGKKWGMMFLPGGSLPGISEVRGKKEVPRYAVLIILLNLFKRWAPCCCFRLPVPLAGFRQACTPPAS